MISSLNRRLVFSLFSALTAFSLVFSSFPHLGPRPALAQEEDQYRATVVLRYPYDATRLAELGLELYAQTEDQAVVFATEDQLATLARRGFRPTDIVALDTLSRLAGAGVGAAELSAMEAPDADGDGLTNQEEAWWCTDPDDPNSDSPLPPSETNPSDYDEVNAILEGITAYGPPFALWPQFTPYNPEGSCPDGDFDGVPDLAEEFIIGTSPLRESSDKDKLN